MLVPMDRQTLALLPQLDSAYFTTQVSGDFFPRVQPVIFTRGPAHGESVYRNHIRHPRKRTKTDDFHTVSLAEADLEPHSGERAALSVRGRPKENEK